MATTLGRDIFKGQQLPGGRCGRDRRHLEKISKVFSLPA
jgi:hypothetical protein